MTAKRETGLSRWARRKAEARDTPAAAVAKRGAALPAPTAEADPIPDATQRAMPAPSLTAPVAETADDQENLVPDHLPDIETLDYDSDFSGFLSKDVSDAVRNVALRKLWRSNPLLANVDGLVDYDDDFSDAATVIEGMKSVYRVGRGMLQDPDDGAEEELAVTADDPEAPDAEPQGPEDAVTAADDTTVRQGEAATQSAEAEQAHDVAEEITDGKPSRGAT